MQLNSIIKYDYLKNDTRIKDSRAQTGDMFKDMDIMDQIHRLKLECAGGTCSIDEAECEACGS